MIGMDRFVIVVCFLGNSNIILPFKIIKCQMQKWLTLELVPFGTEINSTMLFIIWFFVFRGYNELRFFGI